MANFHLSVAVLSRRRGRSAVAAAAYRSASRLFDERREQSCDFRKKQPEIAFSCVLYPEAAPVSWSREELWNRAERSEKRRDAIVAREINLALVHELPVDDQIPLVKKLASEISNSLRIAIDINVHVPLRRARDRRRYVANPHAHLELTTRRIVNGTLGEKTRELDCLRTGRALIVAWRQRWAALLNQKLAERGLAIRVDHRSYLNQGLEELPTIKEGWGPDVRERMEYNDAVRHANRQVHEAQRALDAFRQDTQRSRGTGESPT
jgi:hypothetical protein